MDQSKKGIANYFMLYIKGIAMGAADIVPGVSGGTIALITGVYERLLHSLKSFTPSNFRKIFKEGFGAFWRTVNGSFLIALLLGIGTSVFTLAKLMTYLLETHPVLIWSFFFGLILISTVFVFREVRHKTAPSWIAFAAGAAIAVLITSLSPAETPDALWFIFICGAIAICAMILPGISGSFILLLMGKYAFILAALAELNALILLVFAAGAIVGLLSFSHFLSWLLSKYHDLAIAILSGFMFGSLNKVWPWKSLAEGGGTNVLPTQYGADAQLLAAVLMALAAIVLYLSIEWVARRMQQRAK